MAISHVLDDQPGEIIGPEVTNRATAQFVDRIDQGGSVLRRAGPADILKLFERLGEVNGLGHR